MVFLRPTVVRTDEHSVAVASDRYDYIRGTQFAIQPEPNALLPRIETPALPPLQNGKPVGGALLHRSDDPSASPSSAPPTEAPVPAPTPAPTYRQAPSRNFPVEPPVIDQR